MLAVLVAQLPDAVPAYVPSLHVASVRQVLINVSQVRYTKPKQWVPSQFYAKFPEENPQ